MQPILFRLLLCTSHCANLQALRSAQWLLFLQGAESLAGNTEKPSITRQIWMHYSHDTLGTFRTSIYGTYILQRNRCAGQEATVRTGRGPIGRLQIGKGVHQSCILSPCLFNLYAEYFMQNAGLDEAQAGIKIVGRNINNLRYADDTTIMAESEELKSLSMKVKEENEKAGLKLNIEETKIMASGPITSWQIDGETMETVTDFIFLGSKIIADGDCYHEI